MNKLFPLAVRKIGFLTLAGVLTLLAGGELARGQDQKDKAKDAKEPVKESKEIKDAKDTQIKEVKDAQGKEVKDAQGKEVKDAQIKEAKEVKPKLPMPQPQEEIGDAMRARKASLLLSGYTRPGFPNDKVKDDKIISVVWDFDYKGRIIGGTVYFAVFERSDLNPEGDRYGTGIAGFDEAFVEGRSVSGRYSPGFEAINSKYLYLYQVVNDRGLDPQPILPAAGEKLRTDDIFSYLLRLPCDMGDITSWGYFRDMAFASKVPDRSRSGDIVFAGADGTKEKKIRLAYSSDASILGALPYHEYTSRSPAYPLRGLKPDFGLDRSNLNLKSTKSFLDLEKMVENKIELVGWQRNALEAAMGAKNPTFVELTASEPAIFGDAVGAGAAGQVGGINAAGEGATGQKGGAYASAAGLAAARSFFRVDFNGKNILKPGYASVVFGFTSNLPPVDALVKVVGDRGDGVAAKAAGQGQGGIIGAGLGEQPSVGPGTVPAPAPAPAAPTGGFAGGGFWIGGQGQAPFMPTPPAGGGGGIGAGGITVASPPLVTSAGGNNGGGGNNSTTPANSTNGSNSGSSSTNGSNSGSNGAQNSSQTQTIVYSPTITNQQSENQSQMQQQQQQQQQRQSNFNRNTNINTNHNHHHGNVVPEPAAIILGILGVPVLLLVLRKRKGPSRCPETAC
jgi:hypothetical protein